MAGSSNLCRFSKLISAVFAWRMAGCSHLTSDGGATWPHWRDPPFKQVTGRESGFGACEYRCMKSTEHVPESLFWKSLLE